MTLEIKTDDVTDFLDFMIRTLSMERYAQDKDGYISRGDERLTRGSPPRPVLLYRQTVTDREALVLNPFVEGLKEDASVRWFYMLLWQGLTGRLLELMASVVARAVLEQTYAALKGAPARKAFEKANPAILTSSPASFQPLVMSIIDAVDERTLEEFEAFHDHVRTLGKADQLFLYILYKRKMLSSALDVPLITDPEYPAPKKIRKSSFQAFRTLIMAILGVKKPEDLNKFTAMARDDASSKLDSQILCFFNVVKTINDALDAAGEDLAVDLGLLKIHVDRIPAYSTNAKGVIFSLAEPASTTDRMSTETHAVPTSLPIGTSRIDEALGVRPGTAPPPAHGYPGGLPVVASNFGTPTFGTPTAGPFDNTSPFIRPSFGARSIPITSGHHGTFGPGMGPRGVTFPI